MKNLRATLRLALAPALALATGASCAPLEAPPDELTAAAQSPLLRADVNDDEREDIVLAGGDGWDGVRVGLA